MAAVVSKVQLMVLIPTEAEQWVADQWADQLKAKAERMNENRKAKIPDADEFLTKLAGTAALTYPPFVNPGFYSRSGLDAQDVITSFTANIRAAFHKYNNKLDYLFETVDGIPAKRFKELVDQAKGAFADGLAKRTLPFTGTKRSLRGLSSLSGMWLTDDVRLERLLRGGDVVLFGAPKLICLEAAKPTLRAFLNQRLIQTGALLVKQEWSLAMRTKHNDLTNALLNGYRDPALNIEVFTTDGESHVDWIMINEQPYLEIQVAVTP